MQYISNNDEWVDYPYIGIGEKPYSKNKKKLTEEQLERILGG